LKTINGTKLNIKNWLWHVAWY